MRRNKAHNQISRWCFEGLEALMVRKRFLVRACRSWVLRLALVLTFCPALFAQAGGYLITTVAGGGSVLGDGGLAVGAQLNGPNGVALDSAGNLYVADSANNRIRRVSNGVITTVAGNGFGGPYGLGGFSGDNGPAISAELSMPAGIALDSAGNLYIADALYNRIRKVSNGVITTVAGNGTAGFSGDNTPAASAMLNEPGGVAVDSAGNLYIADSGNSRIRKVSNGVIATVAGDGTRGFDGDNGPATSAELDWPNGVALDSAGNLYVADSDNNRIRKVSNGVIPTVAGNGAYGYSGDGGPATSTELSAPYGVAVDSVGNLYVADTGNNRIREVTPAGIISTVAGNGTAGFSGDDGPATSAELDGLRGIVVDAAGNLDIADIMNNRIRQLVTLTPFAVGCVYSVDQSAQSFGAAGGSVGVLASATSCPWLAISYVDWITITSGASGSGTGLVTYSVSPNPDLASRSGTIWTAGGNSLTVNQSGVTCSLAVGSRSIPAPASGLTGGTLTVTSNAPDCQWTAVANVPWILVSAGNTGTGSGTVTYTVGVNTGGLRTGTITVAGQKVYVNQAASGGSVSSLASLSVGGIVNAASSSPPIAPGSFVSIYGQNLADTATDWSSAIVNGKLPTSLGGVQVVVDGQSAFISYVQPTQVNVLTPPDSAVGPVEVDVITNHGTVVAIGTMAGISPALFTYALQSRFYADALFATDYAYVAAVGALPGVTSRPAKAGDYVLLFATGLGQTNPPYPVGQVLTAAYPVPDPSKVSVQIGGQPAPVQFAGMTYAGLFQINIQVPNGIPAGDQPIVLAVAGQASLPAVYLTFGGDGGL
jgi:uncharacterized protein (TIGR03437 family)